MLISKDVINIPHSTELNFGLDSRHLIHSRSANVNSSLCNVVALFRSCEREKKAETVGACFYFFFQDFWLISWTVFKILATGLLKFVFVKLLRPLTQVKLAQTSHEKLPNLTTAPPSLVMACICPHDLFCQQQCGMSEGGRKALGIRTVHCA